MTHAERYPDNLARAISVSLQNALFLSVGSPNFFLIVFLKKKIEGGKGKHEGGERKLDFDGRLLIYSPGDVKQAGSVERIWIKRWGQTQRRVRPHGPSRVLRRVFDAVRRLEGWRGSAGRAS